MLVRWSPGIQLFDALDVILARLKICIHELKIVLGELLWRLIVRKMGIPKAKTHMHLLLVSVPMRRMRVVVHDGLLVIVALSVVLDPVPIRADSVTTRIEMLNGVEVLDIIETVESGDT